MTAIGLIDRIDGEHTDAVDAELVERGSRSDHFVNKGFVNSEGLVSQRCSGHLAKSKANVMPAKPK